MEGAQPARRSGAPRAGARSLSPSASRRRQRSREKRSRASATPPPAPPPASERSKPSRRRIGRILTWAPPLLLVLQNVAVFARHYFSGAGFPWDFVGAYYAAPAFWTQAVQHGMFPQWMPYQWLGYPFFLNIQTSLFYPPMWIFPALRIPYTLHAAVVVQCLHVLGGAIGMYFFLRVLLRSRREALLGAFAYQLFGGFFSNAEHVDIVRAFAFSPWLLFTLTFRRSDPLLPRRLLAAPLAMFAFVTGAYPGATLGAFVIGGLYPLLQAAFQWRTDERKKTALRVASALALLALGVGMGAASIGPPLLFRREFARTNIGPPSQTGFSLVHLAGLVFPNTNLPGDISMTSTFVGFAVVAAFFLISRRAFRSTAAIAGVALFAGLMAGGSASPVYRIARAVFPLFGSSRFPIADYRAWIAIGLVACGAAALRDLRRRPVGLGKAALRILLLVLFAAWAAQAAFGGGAPAAQIAPAGLLLAASLAALWLWQWRRGRFWLPAFACLLAIQSVDAARVLSAIGITWLVPDQIAVCRSFCKPPAEMHDRGMIVAPQVLAGLNGPRPARIEIGPDLYKAGGYLLGTFNARDNGNMVLESKRAIEATPWMRAYIRAPWTPILLDPAAAAGRVLPPTERGGGAVPGSVRQTHYGLDRIAYEVRLPQPALLLENESYFPGWTASLSGRPEIVPATKVNGGLRAWSLPAGTYRMEARFRLPGFPALAGLAIGCWILWIAALGVALRHHRPSQA